MMQSQMQMFWSAHRKMADLNNLFMDMVRDGMTRTELEKLIAKRPQVYGRFSAFLKRLP